MIVPEGVDVLATFAGPGLTSVVANPALTPKAPAALLNLFTRRTGVWNKVAKIAATVVALATLVATKFGDIARPEPPPVAALYSSWM